METAIVHDYLTQRGGAERVVLSMLKAFPAAPLYTSLYDADRTFPEFADADVHVTLLNRIALFRRWHRLALPVLAPTFSRLEVDADVAVCSSSGWAHGARVRGRKVVYCHAPARWLYQPDRYLRTARGPVTLAAGAFRRPLVRWDRRAAHTATRYLVNSTAVREQVRRVYGIDAEVLAPPPALDADGEQQPVEGVEPGFVLCVSRLLAYKNVDAIVNAFGTLATERLVVVGRGPERGRLTAMASGNVHFLEVVSAAELRWLYANSLGLVAASHEDFGLTPLEAAAFGRPSAVLRWGGFLDTVREGETGVFFDRPEPNAIVGAVRIMSGRSWPTSPLLEQAERFSETRFVSRLREVVAEVRP